MKQVLQIDGSILTARMAEDEEKEYDLENPQHLLAFLIDANIRLVRAEYLLYLDKEKRLWPRRQEAEHETFEDTDGSMKTALVTIEEYKTQDFNLIFSVSHCWEAKQHADPFGFQARELLSRSLDPCDWVFIDFICLPQYYRTAEEQVLFKRAMANMHMLYAHQAVDYVVRLETLADERAKAAAPDLIDVYYEEADAVPGSGQFGPQPFHKLKFNNTPYHERGWCEAEKQWMCTKNSITGFAPMTPARFQERVARGHQNLPDGLVLKFTHRSDEEIVVKLQKKIFLQQVQGRTELCAQDLPESELLLLAESLPHFVNLESLRFRNLEIREANAVALVSGLKPLTRLTNLSFWEDCRMDEKTAKVFGQGLLEFHLAQDLQVVLWEGSGPEKLANELRSMVGTGREVFEGFNGVRAYFTIKAAGWRFGWFGRQLSNFSACCKRRATDPPPATPDNAFVVAHV